MFLRLKKTIYFCLLVTASCLLPTAYFFRASAQYAVNGNASQISCNCYQLTPDAGGQSGSVWNINQIDLSNPFDFYFDVFLGCNDGGADGIVFVLQPVSTTVGGSGGGLGYAGIAPSLGVEIDTYQNGWDPGADHIAILQNGDVNHGSGNNLAGPFGLGNLEDCAYHILRVTWDPATNSFNVYLDGVLIATYNGDIINSIFGGNPNVYWGFTAGTGGSTNDQRFCVAINPVILIAPSNNCLGVPTHFNDQSYSPIGPITSWLWDFGDGTTSTDQNPDHTYLAPGTYNITLAVTDINGCSETTTTSVTIFAAATANSGADDAFCDGSNVTLNGSGGGNYLWSPNTGLSDEFIANPVATPAATTTYTLTVTDVNGCQGTDDVIITVNPLPTPDFSATTECMGTLTQFTDLSSITSGTINQWDWDFDDGNASASQDPAYTYAADGTYNVSLTVTSNANCTSTITNPVTVYPVPVADFSSTTVCAATVTDFTDLTAINTGLIASWDWNFGDGTAHSTDINAQHIYSVGNTYNVTLSVVSDFGCTDAITQPVTVYHVPVADFTATDACLGDISTFTDNSTIPAGTISGWIWSFGNGIFSVAAQDTVYEYIAPGNYTVGIQVTSSDGCTDTETGPITVSDLPVADFSFSDVCQNETAVFVDESTIPSGNITQWEWNFNDGSAVFTGAAPPAHSFPNWGGYDVQLIVTSGGTCKDTITQMIGVYPTPVPDFVATTECLGTATVFNDFSDIAFGSVESWTYDFDDNGVITNNANPLYTFSNYGTFNVNLTVASDFGCEEDTVFTVRVHPVATANFSATSVCLNETTAFTDESTIPQGTIIGWDWNFNDGGTSTLQNSFHTYGNSGIFNVNLSVTSDSGCVADTILPVEVFPLPDVDFTSDIVEGCQPLPVNFTDLSVVAPGYNIVWWLWEFGDGNTSSDQNPLHVYDTAGVFDVVLQAKTSNGCTISDTAISLITVYPKPVAAFSATPLHTEIIYPYIEINDLSSGANQWQYDFGDSTNSSMQEPSHNYADTGIYIIQQIVTNQFACKDTAYFTVYIDPTFTFYIPNTFTPNADGNNDYFYGAGIGITGYEMRIYNRWGEQVFASFDEDIKWNGLIEKSQNLATQDVYSYTFRVKDIYDAWHAYRGRITVLGGELR
jgi:gliding motility-associated-like protein